jgi:sugar lactone lactonase YvrE
MSTVIEVHRSLSRDLRLHSSLRKVAVESVNRNETHSLGTLHCILRYILQFVHPAIRSSLVLIRLSISMQFVAATFIRYLVAVLVLYLVAWPVPLVPVAWQAAQSPGYTGVHAINTRLSNLHRIELGGHEGPEHVALGLDGLLYAAVAGGRVLRFFPNGSQLSVFAQTGGRVLGFDFDAGGRMIAADAVRGLLSIDREGSPLSYADAVTVAPDGKIYFTDASQRFSPRDWGGTFEACVLDLLENSATGRVLMFDPKTGQVQLIAGGLSFPNGIAMSADGEDIFVVETGRYRLWRISVHARDLMVTSITSASSSQPLARIIFDNLPGYPDNVMRGFDGRLWMGLVKPRTALVDSLSSHPWLRTVVARLPRFMWPLPKPYGHVIAFNEDGHIIADLQDPSGSYPETTAVTETPEQLFVQSLHAGWLAWLPSIDFRQQLKN